MSETKESTVIDDKAAALVMHPDGRVDLLFPAGSLDGDGSDDDVPEHCMVLAALGAMAKNAPDEVDAIINKFLSGHYRTEEPDVGTSEQ